MNLNQLIDNHFREEKTTFPNDEKPTPIYKCKMCNTYVKGKRRRDHLYWEHHVYFRRMEIKHYGKT